METSKDEKPFVCLTCGTCFLYQTDFTIHLQSHNQTQEQQNAFNEMDNDTKYFPNPPEFDNDTNVSMEEELITIKNEADASRMEWPLFEEHKSEASSMELPLFEEQNTRTGNDKHYECNVCDKTFMKESGLVRHMQYHQKERPFKCYVCERSFVYPSELKSHVAIHGESAGMKLYRCGICEESFETPKDYRTHCRENHPEGNFAKTHQCDKCEKSFVSKVNLKNHSLVHSMSDETKHKCEVCGKTYVCHYKLRRHMKYHLEERPYTCDICGKGFVFPSDLRKHSVVHLENKSEHKSFKCLFCDEYFKTSQGRKTHCLVNHPGQKPAKIHGCDICGRSFQFKGSLNNHLLTHSGEKESGNRTDRNDSQEKSGVEIEKTYDVGTSLIMIEPDWVNVLANIQSQPDDYESDVGGLSPTSDPDRETKVLTEKETPRIGFKTEENRVDSPSDFEMAVAENEYDKYTCDICGKRYKNKGQMESHKLNHTMSEHPNKMNICKICGKGFEWKHVLKKHLITHTDVKPFKCSVCDMSFHFECDLNRHLGTHPGTKPYMCWFCEEFFCSPRELKKHMREEHPGENIERPFKCKKCGKGLKFKGSLRNHYLKCSESPQENCKGSVQKPRLSDETLGVSTTLIEPKEENVEVEIQSQSDNYESNVRSVLSTSNSDSEEKVLTDKKLSTISSDTEENGVDSPSDFEVTMTECDSNKHACDICGKSYRSKGKMESHKLIHTNEYPYKCNQCDRRYMYPSTLRKHLIVHAQNKKPPSYKGIETSTIIGDEKNGSLIANRDSDSRHNPTNSLDDDNVGAQTHKEDNAIIIQSTIKSCSISPDVEEKEASIGIKSNICHVCGKGFVLPSELNDHFVTHPDEKPYECMVCGERFRLLKVLKKHMPKVHPGIRPYKCEHCDCSYSSTSNLRKHMKSHLEPNTGEEKSLLCDTCGKAFSDKMGLKQHQLIHAEKSNKCIHCGKSFYRKAEMKRHIITMHTDHKPFQCHICEKKFAYGSILKKHMVCHSEKSHICFVCGKGFYRRYCLKNHQKRHTGVLLFECPLCGKKLVGQLKRHLVQVHGENGDDILKKYNLSEIVTESSRLKYQTFKESFGTDHNKIKQYKDYAKIAENVTENSSLKKHTLTWIQNEYSRIQQTRVPIDQNAGTNSKFGCYEPKMNESKESSLSSNSVNINLGENVFTSSKLRHGRVEYPQFSKGSNLDLMEEGQVGRQVNESDEESLHVLSDFDDFVTADLEGGKNSTKKCETDEKYPPGSNDFTMAQTEESFSSQTRVTDNDIFETPLIGYDNQAIVDIFARNDNIKIMSSEKSDTNSFEKNSFTLGMKIKDDSFTSQLSDSDAHTVDYERETKEMEPPTNETEVMGVNNKVDDMMGKRLLPPSISMNRGLQKSDADGKKFERSTYIENSKKEKPLHFCETCGKSFKWPSELKKHSISHMEVKPKRPPKKCQICEKIVCNLSRHMKSHTEQKWPQPKQDKNSSKYIVNSEKEKLPHFCETCGKSFKWPSELKKHLISHSEVKPKRPPKKCEICGKFSHRMKDHMQIHSENPSARPHLCDICGKGFRFKADLYQHSQTHTAKHQCQQCGKFFQQKREMKRHVISIHSDNKPFQCQICEKKFAYGYMLKKHLVCHSEKSHICSICGKTFLRRQSLKHHQWVHTGEKRIICPICGQRLVGRLKRHLVQVHGEKEGDILKK